MIEAQYGAPGVEPVAAAGPAQPLATGVAERIADAQSTSGLFAVVAQRRGAVDLLTDAGLALVAHAITDPGNLGTMLRTAEAAGVDAVVVTPGTVDPHNPKVVRVLGGLPVLRPHRRGGLADVAAAGLRTIATSSTRGVAHHGRLAGASPSSPGARRTDCLTMSWSTTGCASSTPVGPRA